MRPPPQSSWPSYLRWLFGTLVATILAVGAFNLLIDPLNVFGAPRIAGLNAIKPHLVPGSVILVDELTWSGAPGEAIAFKEAFRDVPYRIEKCRLYPSKSIVTVQ